LSQKEKEKSGFVEEIKDKKVEEEAEKEKKLNVEMKLQEEKKN
jgi:hypothetical protein